jgi:hypothetical protein
MSRFPLFLVCAFLTVIGMIALALLPLMPAKTQIVEAKSDMGTLVFDAKSLNQIVPARGFPVTASPGPRGDQNGPRLASVSALAPDAAFSKGSRLLLGAKTSASLQGQPVTILIAARGIPKSPASKMAVGIVRNGPIEWIEAQVPSNVGPVRFDVPAAPEPITAIAFWPATEGQGRGVEIQSLSLQTTNQQVLP